MAALQPLEVSSSRLPSGDTRIFPSSTFFRAEQHRELPTPAEVRTQAASRHIPNVNTWRPPPIELPTLNLMVKYGGAVTIAEGQCLWMIRTHLGDTVPVPEVYGWCRDGVETFIYMELVTGSTLEQRWDKLSVFEKSSICSQLSPIVAALGKLKQSSSGLCCW